MHLAESMRGNLPIIYKKINKEIKKNNNNINNKRKIVKKKNRNCKIKVKLIRKSVAIKKHERY